MLAAATTKIAALVIVAAVAGFSGKAFASTGAHHTPASSFGTATGYVTSLDHDVEGGTMRQVPCAAGHQPGASCYLAR